MTKLLPLLTSILLLGCASPTPSQEAKLLKLDPQSRTFIAPATGQKITLSLGKNIRNSYSDFQLANRIIGFQQDTESFYKIGDQKIAESSVIHLHDLDFVTLQHDSSTGRTLIIEDTSDALSVKRYILLTPANQSFTSSYLSPDEKHWHEDFGESFAPPDLILLPENKVKIQGGPIINLNDIVQSPTPFSVGG